MRVGQGMPRWRLRTPLPIKTSKLYVRKEGGAVTNHSYGVTWFFMYMETWARIGLLPYTKFIEEAWKIKEIKY
jgi:hypothetical protein